MVEAGLQRESLLKAGLVTPSCGLGALDQENAQRVFELLVGVSQEMRHRYVVSAPAPEQGVEPS